MLTPEQIATLQAGTDQATPPGTFPNRLDEMTSWLPVYAEMISRSDLHYADSEMAAIEQYLARAKAAIDMAMALCIVPISSEIF